MKRKCRYCHETGHNVRTCPVVNRDAANGHGWARTVQNRTNERSNNTVRLCTYCQTQGHNVKTCPKKLDDNNKVVRDTRTFRRSFVAACKEINFGVGTLINHAHHGVGLVVGFNVEDIHSKTLDENVSCVRTLFPKNNSGTYTVGLPTDFYHKFNVTMLSYRDYPTIKSKTTTTHKQPSQFDWKWEEVVDQQNLLTKLGHRV